MKTGKKPGRGYAENSLKALEPTKFTKENPRPGPGRPKGSLSLKDHFNKFLELDVKIKMPDGSIQDKTILDSILMSLLVQAQKGNIRAIQEVLDRNYGKSEAIVSLEDTTLKQTVSELKDAVDILKKHERDY